MKAIYLSCCLSFATEVGFAQVPPFPLVHPTPSVEPPPQEVGPPGDGVYSITSAGPHHRRWARRYDVRAGDGSFKSITDSYVELASGLNRVDDNGRYVPAESQFELVPGAAIARNTAHKLILAASPTDEKPVDLLTPDNHRMTSRILGLSYFSPSSGRSAMIAETKVSQGILVAPNQVLYEDAFDGGFEADIRYTLMLSGVEQDIILREQLPSPSDFNLFEADVQLEVITEFLESVEPVVSEPDEAELTADPIEPGGLREAAVVDQTLWFGAMHMGQGAAFALPADGQAPRASPIRTAKHWTSIEGRNVLFEAIDLRNAHSALSKLPPRRQAALQPQRKPLDVASHSRVLPRVNPTKSRLSMLAAGNRAKPAREGFVIDYSILSSITNFVFKSDTTYYATNIVSLSGKTVFEGGTVVKFERNSVLSLPYASSIDCQTAPYRPVLLTAKDDDSVGTVIPGSTGIPTGFYATANLRISSLTYYGAKVIDGIHSRYAYVGLDIPNTANVRIQNCQITKCDTGIKAFLGAQYPVRNVLINEVNTAFYGDIVTFRVENSTIRDVNSLGSHERTYLYFTNSIIAGVTNNYMPYANISGMYSPSSSGIFQSAGAGSCYLAAESPYRNVGTTNINPELLVALRRKTTFPPIEITSDFTEDTVLVPQAKRDADIPDLGYHYEPLDWCWGGRAIANSTVSLSGGAAIGIYGHTGTTLQTGGHFVSQGSPRNPNVIVRYELVQDQPSIWGGFSPTSRKLFDVTGTGTVALTFTDVLVPGGLVGQRALLQATATPATMALSHSTFHGVAYTASPGNSGMALNWTNNCWSRCELSFNQPSGSPTFTLSLFNNLFFKGNVAFTYGTTTTPWTIKDNLFDVATLTIVTNAGITASHNGYSSGLATLGGSGNIINLIPDYNQGPYGSFYYPVATWWSGSLSSLKDAGSRGADAAGLYHFTSNVGQTKELDSTVDIGFHYPSLMAFDATSGWSGVQGLGHWLYQWTETTQDLPGATGHDLTFISGANARWQVGDPEDMGKAYTYVGTIWMHPGPAGVSDSVRTFVIPYSGVIQVDSCVFDLDATGGDGVKARIFLDSNQMVPWTAIGNGTDVFMARPLRFGPIAVNAGSKIHFILDGLNSNSYDTTYWNPVISYIEYAASPLSFDAPNGFSGTQGANNWRYQRTWSLAGLPDAGIPDLPSYDSNPSYPHWHYDAGDAFCHIWSTGQHPGNSYDTVRTFRCPVAGTIRIDSAAYDGQYGGGSDGTRARIVKDGTELVSWTQITEGSTPSTAIPLNVSAVPVSSGTRIFFQLNKNSSNAYDTTQWAPRISYLSWTADADLDGIPDYWEDRNGNGVFDSGLGETDWQTSNSPVGGAAGLQIWTPLRF